MSTKNIRAAITELDRGGVVNQDITVGGREKSYFELRELNQEVAPRNPKIYT